MKNNGVVRRIDDLGRVVIPKEIRRRLRIKDGESLEIFLDSDNIVLKKYNTFDNTLEFYKNYVDSLEVAIKDNILITDRDHVIAMAGDLKKDYISKSVSKYLESVMESREYVFADNYVEVELVNGVVDTLSYVLSPIIVNGDCTGSIIIMSKKNKMTDFEHKTVLIAAKFLGKYLEN